MPTFCIYSNISNITCINVWQVIVMMMVLRFSVFISWVIILHLPGSSSNPVSVCWSTSLLGSKSVGINVIRKKKNSGNDSHLANREVNFSLLQKVSLKINQLKLPWYHQNVIRVQPVFFLLLCFQHEASFFEVTS